MPKSGLSGRGKAHKNIEVASDTESMSRRAKNQLVPVVPSDGEEVMRCALEGTDEWGSTLSYLIGPTQTQSLKVAQAMNRLAQMPGETDRLVYEEAVMMAMAGDEAKAKEMTRGMK